MPNEWQMILDEIKANVSDMAFNTYFVNAKYVSSGEKVITFSVPSSFVKSSIEKKYRDKILLAFKNTGVKYNDFNITISDSTTKPLIRRRGIEVIPGAENNTAITPPHQIQSSPFKVNNNGLNTKYRLNNYVVGNNNNLAVSAAQAIIENPGTRYNPFFLYGSSGLGKTHLIQAIGNEIHEQHPEMNILYVTIEEFYSDFVYSMRKKVDGFKEKYRKVDVLIIDDFQFITGKEASQDEFFHTFNELYKQNKQVVISADRLPSQIKDVDPRLASRLTMGVSVDIQMPDFETRCAIVTAKADLLGATIDNTTVEYLAENFNTNIRDLEGELNRVLLLADVRGVPTSQVIGEITPITHNNIHRISPKQVVDKVAKYYNLSSKELYGTSRIRDIKNARQIAMYLMRKDLELSTTKIGKEFDKDHTTIMHAIQVVDKRMKEDFNLREEISEIRGKLNANL